MDKFEVEFYTKANGEKPAKDFILGLDVKMRAKVLGIINVLEEKGNPWKSRNRYNQSFIFFLLW